MIVCLLTFLLPLYLIPNSQTATSTPTTEASRRVVLQRLLTKQTKVGPNNARVDAWQSQPSASFLFVACLPTSLPSPLPTSHPISITIHLRLGLFLRPTCSLKPTSQSLFVDPFPQWRKSVASSLSLVMVHAERPVSSCKNQCCLSSSVDHALLTRCRQCLLQGNLP